MSDVEPIIPFPRSEPGRGTTGQWNSGPAQISFDRKELNLILNLYGMHVAEGEWRDYAMDFGREVATFSIFRRTSEVPLYRIVKNPGTGPQAGALCGHCPGRAYPEARPRPGPGPAGADQKTTACHHIKNPGRFHPGL